MSRAIGAPHVTACLATRCVCQHSAPPLPAHTSNPHDGRVFSPPSRLPRQSVLLDAASKWPETSGLQHWICAGHSMVSDAG